MVKSTSPAHVRRPDLHTGWARFGGLSRWVATRIRPLSPPILVLGLPRSGTSWVGSVLGQAPNAMYLREPVNQSYQKHGRADSVVEVTPGHMPGLYQSAAEKAFAAIPDFDRGVVQHHAQWSLLQRQRRRLVIKEVNPLACGWYLQCFRPRVIFVVRHPAGVALSHRALKWGDTVDEHYWQDHGRYQGETLRAAFDALQDYPEVVITVFEKLCADPVAGFRHLYRFAGLDWDRHVEAWITQHSSAGERADAYGTQRNSVEVAQAWKSEITPEALAELRRAYQAFALPWYDSIQDWSIGSPPQESL